MTGIQVNAPLGEVSRACRPSLVVAAFATFACFVALCAAVHADDAVSTAAVDCERPTADDKHKLRYGGKTFEQWRDQLLYDLEPQTELGAIQALAVFGENGFAEEAAVEIAKVLRRKNVQVLQAACAALGGLGKPAVPALARALENDSPEVRAAAAQALGQIGPDAAAAVPALLEAARDQSPPVQKSRSARNTVLQARQGVKRALANANSSGQAAASALGRIGIDDEEYLRELVELFETSPQAIRLSLVGGFYGHRLKQGDIRFLIVATDDDDESLRAQAAAALVYGASDDDNVRYVIEQLIHNDTNQVRDQIVNTLMGAQQLTGAAPLLVACLRSRDIQTRFANQTPVIIQAIGREGATAAVATDALIELIDIGPNQGQAESIAAAMDALAGIGPAASKAAAALTAWTESKDLEFGNGDRVSSHARRALRKITAGQPRE